MKIGLMYSNCDYAMRPDDFAREAEARGFESLWLPEHSHIPASRRTPYPGGDLPKDYWHTRDIFVSLGAAAAATSRIKLGTGICLAQQRDPIWLAKEVATIDELSNGRFLFGIGAGWNAEEMENHGIPFNKRWAILREKIAAMKAIWTQENAEYHGTYVNFDPIWMYPKPVQKPHPPIILGSATGAGLQRIAEYCDGWIPIGFMIQDLPAAIADLQARTRAAGRATHVHEVSIFWANPDPGEIRKYAEAGAHRAILALPAEGRDILLPMLDEYAKLLENAA